MTTLNEWFEKGLTTEQYMDQMTTNKENMAYVLNKFNLPEDQAFFDELSKRNLKVIVITEDWCADAMMNNPVLIKLAEKSNMNVRFILRDSNLELMDQYLTNGTARSIPIFIFVNEMGEEVGKWGPRAEEVQAFVGDAITNLPAKEDPTFKEEQQLFIKKLTDAYKEREEFWLFVYEELKKTLQA